MLSCPIIARSNSRRSWMGMVMSIMEAMTMMVSRMEVTRMVMSRVEMEDGDEQGRSDDVNGRNNEQHGSDGDDGEQSGSAEETTNNQVEKPLGNPKRKRDDCSAQVASGKSHSESNGAVEMICKPTPPKQLLARTEADDNGRRPALSDAYWQLGIVLQGREGHFLYFLVWTEFILLPNKGSVAFVA